MARGDTQLPRGKLTGYGIRGHLYPAAPCLSPVLRFDLGRRDNARPSRPGVGGKMAPNLRRPAGD